MPTAAKNLTSQKYSQRTDLKRKIMITKSFLREMANAVSNGG